MRQLLVVAGDRALSKFVAETLLGRKITPNDPMMQGNGWEIARAHTGLEALLLVTKSGKHFDAIVLDQHLPDRDVLQLLDALRSSPESEEIPIFVMSERGRDHLARRLASDAYFVAGFIDKPVTSESLRRGLKNLHRTRVVLLVDAMTERRDEFAKVLKQAGYSVDIASDTKTALSLVASNRPDAVVSALKLQDRSGALLCLELKRQPGTHAIPVLLHGHLDDLANTEIEENAHRADDFLGPDLTGEALLARLSTLVGRGTSGVSSAPPPGLSLVAGDPQSTMPQISKPIVQTLAGKETAELKKAEQWENQKTPTGEGLSPSKDRTETRDDLDGDANGGSARTPLHPSLPPASASPSHNPSTKRSNRRVPCNLSVSIKDGETIYRSSTLNISDGGILITTEHPLKIGAHIDLTLELPTSERPITAVGKVAWFGAAPAGPDGSARSGVGVKFSRIDPKDLQAIVDYVNHISKVVYVAP